MSGVYPLKLLDRLIGLIPSVNNQESSVYTDVEPVFVMLVKTNVPMVAVMFRLVPLLAAVTSR